MGREGEVLSQLMPAFEKEHPGIHVEVQQIPWTAAHEKLLTAYVGEATPDIAMLGNTWVPEFVALNSLEALDELVAGSHEIRRDDFFDGIWKTNVVGGKTYGIPWYVDTRIIFYRTDLLAKAGYKEFPTTWNEWVSAMKKIKAGMSPSQYPLLMPTNEWPQPVIFALNMGSPILRDGGRYGAFEQTEFRRGYDFYLSLYRQGLSSPVSTSQVSNLFQEFERGNIAMFISGPWYIGEMKTRLDPMTQKNWMTAAIPGPNGPGASTAGGSSLSLFAGSKHKKEAWTLMEYLSRPSVQTEFYKLTGDLPPRKTAWADTTLANNKYARAFLDQLDFHFMKTGTGFDHPNATFVFSPRGAWAASLTGATFAAADLTAAWGRALSADDPSPFRKVAVWLIRPAAWVLLACIGLTISIAAIVLARRPRVAP